MECRLGGGLRVCAEGLRLSVRVGAVGFEC